MTETQSKKLGELIARARTRRGMSTRQLATRVGVAYGWISGVEAGRFREPAANRVARIAEVLDIEPSRIDRLTKGSIAGGLPGMRTYFRAKYDLTPDQIGQIERYIDRLRGSK